MYIKRYNLFSSHYVIAITFRDLILRKGNIGVEKLP